MSERLIRQLAQFLGDEGNRVSQALASGIPRDYAEYRYLVGCANTLVIVQQFLKAKEQEQSND
jgi:hypothetical protein